MITRKPAVQGAANAPAPNTSYITISDRETDRPTACRVTPCKTVPARRWYPRTDKNVGNIVLQVT